MFSFCGITILWGIQKRARDSVGVGTTWEKRNNFVVLEVYLFLSLVPQLWGLVIMVESDGA